MEIVTKIAPIILALIMLGLGLGLKLEDFGRVLKTPKDFIVGFISQLIILPIVAYILILIFKTPPEIAIGVMIIAAAPGGVTSNIMTKFADGDVALSISLTAVISLLSIITVPLIIFTSADFLGITEMSKKNLGIVCVKEKSGKINLITDGDLRRHSNNLFKKKIIKVCSKNPAWISDSATALSAINKMNDLAITSLLVAKNKDIKKKIKKIVGVLHLQHCLSAGIK